MKTETTTQRTSLVRFGCLILAGCLLAGLSLHAQPGGFGGGGFGGGGFGGNNSSRRSSSRSTTDYPSSTDIGQARITYDAETRSIIVVADEDTAMHITNVVRQLDQPTPQVLIHCVFMEATYSKGTDIGVDGTYTHTISGSSVGAINTPASTPAKVNTASTAFDLATSGGMYALVGKDLNLQLAALAKAGKTEILSRPSILARNNQQATITIGQQVPLISGVTYDNFGNQRNAISYQDVGIILQVTPFITSDGMVEMIVAPEVSSVSDSTVSFASGGSNDVGGATAPIINVRSADTVVVVPDGETVVIGGLMQTVKTKSEKKVPILGDIPLLGMLFKHKTTDDEKKELLIFLTPRIVKRPSELAAHTASERSKAAGANQAFSKEELNRYLNEPMQPQYKELPVAPKAQN
jgi:general secretion pathway protein D